MQFSPRLNKFSTNRSESFFYSSLIPGMERSQQCLLHCECTSDSWILGSVGIIEQTLLQTSLCVSAPQAPESSVLLDIFTNPAPTPLSASQAPESSVLMDILYKRCSKPTLGCCCLWDELEEHTASLDKHSAPLFLPACSALYQSNSHTLMLLQSLFYLSRAHLWVICLCHQEQGRKMTFCNTELNTCLKTNPVQLSCRFS